MGHVSAEWLIAYVKSHMYRPNRMIGKVRYVMWFNPYSSEYILALETTGRTQMFKSPRAREIARYYNSDATALLMVGG